MPITLPNDLPAFDILSNEGVMVMSPGRAATQDIRPLRIGLLNLMPKKIQTENQFARLIGATPLDEVPGVGASRKRFLGTLLADRDGTPRPPDGRETATAVVSALAARHGAWGVRVHDVRASVDAVKVVAAWEGGHEEDTADG